jgi:hypothetical protein
MDQEITLFRGPDQVTQKLHLESLETATGQVLELHSRLTDGASVMATEAHIRDDSLQITFESGSSSDTRTIDWNREWRGFFAEQQLLREQPLQPQESRSFVSFLPVLNVVARTTLTARDWEDVETPFGVEKLLRVESAAETQQLTLHTTLWCDARGGIRKYFMPQANITGHRTVKELALAPNDDVDLYQTVHLRVSNPLPDPHHTRRAVYQGRLRSGADPLQVFPHDLSQRVRRLEDGAIEIEVLAVRPDIPAQLEQRQPQPGPEDLAANSLVQSDDRLIRSLAEQVAPDEQDPWRWAVACEAYVFRLIEEKNLSQTFATAAEVARSRSGDCTEHAVLTAALCRAHGIPARVATGLVAVDDMFAFHMWNEVWIQDRWVPLDATLGLAGIGAGHIKLGVSSLEGVSPFAALVPVLEVMGTLELDVVAYE